MYTTNNVHVKWVVPYSKLSYDQDNNTQYLMEETVFESGNKGGPPQAMAALHTSHQLIARLIMLSYNFYSDISLL